MPFIIEPDRRSVEATCGSPRRRRLDDQESPTMCSQMEQDPQKKKNDQDCALMGFGSQFALGAARASIKTAKSSTPTVANQ